MLTDIMIKMDSPDLQFSHEAESNRGDLVKQKMAELRFGPDKPPHKASEDLSVMVTPELNLLYIQSDQSFRQIFESVRPVGYIVNEYQPPAEIPDITDDVDLDARLLAYFTCKKMY